MEGLVKRMEGTSSKVWLFLLGLLVAAAVAWVLHSRKQLAVSRARHEHKAKLATERAKRAKTKEEAQKYRDVGKAHRAKAVEINKSIKAIDEQVQDTHARIDAARSIDELAKL